MFKLKFTTRTLTALAMLIAIEVILSRFLSINAWNIKIGFGFVPVVIAAILYGPLAGGIVGALSDFIGALLFPIGTYFPGFTLTSFLMGMIFGLFLYKKQGWLQGLASVGINQFILGLFLNIPSGFPCSTVLLMFPFWRRVYFRAFSSPSSN